MLRTDVVNAHAQDRSGPTPGCLVRHPDRPDWGVGQVQSVIGHRVTVNFEDAGKLVIDRRVVSLVEVQA